MRRRGRTRPASGAGLAPAVSALTASAATATGASAAASSLVPRVGTGGPQTGPFTPSGPGDVIDEEFAGEGEEEAEGPDPFDGTISLSTAVGHGSSAKSAGKAKSNPQFDFGFEGLNF